MKRLSSFAAVLLVVCGALMFGAADRARAGSVYYAGSNGSTWNFGTVNSAGQTTVLGTGLTFGGTNAEKLMFAPNGTLYGFDVTYGGGSGAWGSINTATGAFTQIGNLNTYFPSGLDHNENYGFSLAFGPSGNLYATGYGTDANYDYGTLSLTTGAFTKIAASPVAYAGSLAAWGNTVYYAGSNGSTWNFGTVNSAGQTTVLGTGLHFGGADVEKLMFAPNGTLYGFDVAYGGGTGVWGSINTANGAFTQIGNLNTYFPAGEDHNENYGFSLAFGSSGNLYATGYGTDGNWDYGTLNLTTGVFTKIAASPVQAEGSLASPIPEPSTIVLLCVGALSLFAYGWRRRCRVRACTHAGTSATPNQVLASTVCACVQARTLRSSVAVFLVVFGALMFGVVGRARGGGTYFTTWAPGLSSVPFGTINASGNTTPIGSGLNFGSGDENPCPQFLVAPNGTLYAFDTGALGNIANWGTVNPTTGAFTKIGNLSSVFENGGYGGPPVLGFDSSGDLIACGYSTTNNPIFGTLSLTTGAFTSTADASTGILNALAQSPGGGYSGFAHIVTVPNQGTYYATWAPGLSSVPFGRIDASGNATPIGGGLSFGPGDENPCPQFLVAPNGTLYAFDTGALGNIANWGTVNLATGAFTKIGNLSSVFENGGYGGPPVLGFDSSGDLIACG
jgi:hypothetical protein